MNIYHETSNPTQLAKTLAASSPTSSEQLTVLADMNRSDLSDKKRRKLLAYYLNEVQPLHKELVHEILPEAQKDVRLRRILTRRWQELPPELLQQVVDGGTQMLIEEVLSYGLIQHVSVKRWPAYLTQGNLEAATEILLQETVTCDHLALAVASPCLQLSRHLPNPDVVANLVRQLNAEIVTKHVKAGGPSAWWLGILELQRYSPEIMETFYTTMLKDYLKDVTGYAETGDIFTLIERATNLAAADRYRDVASQLEQACQHMRNVLPEMLQTDTAVAISIQTLNMFLDATQQSTAATEKTAGGPQTNKLCQRYASMDILRMLQSGTLTAEDVTRDIVHEHGGVSKEAQILTLVEKLEQRPRYHTEAAKLYKTLKKISEPYTAGMRRLGKLLTFDEQVELLPFKEMMNLIGPEQMQQWKNEHLWVTLKELLALGAHGLTFNEIATVLQPDIP